MGTNYYLCPPNGQFPVGYPYVDLRIERVKDGYVGIHIAKTSCGWKPIFQAYPALSSVNDIKTYIKDTNALILDEYGDEYSLAEFEERVINWDGGKKDIKPKSHLVRYKEDIIFDTKAYADEEGYEFTHEYFC